MLISCRLLLLAPLVLFGATGTIRLAVGVGACAGAEAIGCLGGAAAIGTTPPLPAAAPAIVPFVAAAFGLLAEPAFDFGDSDSFCACTEPGVVAVGDV